MLSNVNANKYFTPAASAKIVNLVTDLKKQGARNPILFYPSVETKEDMKQGRVSNQQGRLSNQQNYLQPYLVIDNRTLDANGIPIGFINDEYAGYVFGTNGQLEYSQQITEEFAWENDVWVVGEEENCSEENMVAAPDDDGNPNGRIRNDGDAEYGGIIQVTDLGAIEPWINGKVDLGI